MPREIGNSSVVNELNSGSVRTAYLFELSLLDVANNEEELIYCTNNSYNIRYEGLTYYALGYLLNVSGLEEYSDSRISSVTVQLAGINESLIGTLLSYQYLDRPCCIKRIFLSDDKIVETGDGDSQTSEQLLDLPVTIFEGTVETPVINESQSKGEVVIQISASSRFSEFQMKSGRHTNPVEQLSYDSGDKLFDMVGKIDPNLVWGKDVPA